MSSVLHPHTSISLASLQAEKVMRMMRGTSDPPPPTNGGLGLTFVGLLLFDFYTIFRYYNLWKDQSDDYLGASPAIRLPN